MTDHLLLDHGSGGQLSHDLIEQLMVPAFDSPELRAMGDGAVMPVAGGRMAFSTDSYVVDPIFFPGGDIGDLAINGTVNDVAMCGAVPQWLSVGLILEEGFPMADLERIVTSMRRAAVRAGVAVVTGDTKVVPKGAADKIFINTAGIGILRDGIDVGGHRAAPGDVVILSGTMADHGVTIMTQREGMRFESDVKSDSAPLNHMVAAILETCADVHVLRDPTRGGVGTTLNEIARQSQVGIRIDEDALPIRDSVAGICDLLGFDPLYMANEGKLLCILPEAEADVALAAIQSDSAGIDARVIGRVAADPPERVVLRTRIGGERIVGMLAGAQLPRIC